MPGPPTLLISLASRALRASSLAPMLASSCLHRQSLRTPLLLPSTRHAVHGHGHRVLLRMPAVQPCVRPFALKRRTSRTTEGSDASNLIEQLQKEVQQLQREVRRHDDLYYNKAQPIISDDAYDSLKKQLQEKSQQLQQLTGASTFTNVGAVPVSALPKVKHLLPMLSLASVKTRAEVSSWYNRLRAQHKAAGATDWVVEPKIDGLAVRLLYQDGSLVQAATRGDGTVGEDITHNASTVSGLPLTVPSCIKLPRLLEVRGEVYIKHDDFEKVNIEQQSLGLVPFANTRNAAAGSLRLLDPELCRKRRLSFIAYQLLVPPANATPTTAAPSGNSTAAAAANSAHVKHLTTTQWQVLQWLAAHGFATSVDNVLCGRFEDAIEAAEEWMARRSHLGYDVDGVVFKVNQLALQDVLGSSSADPLWAVAWKFPAAEATTKLLDIELNIGRTGMIAPVAVLEPVALQGVTISRATLHNVGFIMQNDLRKGDTVIIRRSGDVIPQVMGAMKELRSAAQRPWQPPSRCPSCQGPLTWQRTSDAETLWCNNSSCSHQSTAQVAHFASVCLEDSQAGKSVVQQLVDANLVSNPADFYQLKEADLLKLDKWGPKRAAILLNGIQASKSMPLSRLLHGLGITMVGERTARELAACFSTLEDLARADEKDIRAVGGSVGDKKAAAIKAWFNSAANKNLIQQLKQAGIQYISGATKPDGGTAPAAGASSSSSSSTKQPATTSALPALKSLSGMKLVVTGKLQRAGITRDLFEQALLEAGATLQKDVSKATDLLVVGVDGGSKLSKAQQRGVPIMTEEQFWDRYGA